MKHSNYNKRKAKKMKKQVTYESEQAIRLELEKFRLPLITRIFKKAWFYFLKFTFLPAFFILLALFICYNSMAFYSSASNLIWNLCKGIIFFYIFGVGGFAVISFVCETRSTTKLCQKLGLTHDELQYYIRLYQIKGY
jgi:hypothetical protein